MFFILPAMILSMMSFCLTVTVMIVLSQMMMPSGSDAR